MSKKILFYLIIVIISIINPITVLAQEKLIFSADVIRHGDRTPISEFPKSPYLWNEGLGELTPKGMQQEYELGVRLHQRYIEQYHLLPTHYASDNLYVESTDTNRTLMSAQCFLLGLYPLGSGPYLNQNQFALPSGFQPIPVHIENNYLIIKPRRNPISLIRMNYEYYKLNKNKYLFNEKFKRWSDATGIKIKDFSDLDTLADTLFVRQQHNIPLPNGISQADADEIIFISTNNWLTLFQQSDFSYPTGHKFLVRLKKYLQDAASDKNKLKSIFFFAHDSTILGILDTMGVQQNHWPQYAEDLNFSLFQDNKNYFVKITLNDKPIIIPTCQSNTCAWSQFLEVVNK